MQEIFNGRFITRRWCTGIDYGDLDLKEKTPFSNITLGAASSKLDFQLVANIQAIDEDSSEVQLEFNGKFNAMMAMMVKKPLTSFIETLTDNLEEIQAKETSFIPNSFTRFSSSFICSFPVSDMPIILPINKLFW